MAAGFVFLLLVAACSVQSFYLPDHEFDETPLGKAIDKASIKVLKGVFDAASDKNVFSSPLQALIILSQYLSGTTEGGKPQSELTSLLGVKDYSKAGKEIALTADEVTLFNVISFQVHWSVPFKAEETKYKDFHLTKDKTVKKPTMQIMQSLFYHESPALGARLVELPYKEKGFRMVIVLPDEIDGLPSVLEKASRNGLLDEIFKLEPAGRDVSLTLPKFEIESDLDLKGILEKVAAPTLSSHSVVISRAFQKTSIQVDEEGATAGAFTGRFLVNHSGPSELDSALMFHVDRPFLYVILHEDKIIFIGTYTH